MRKVFVQGFDTSYRSVFSDPAVWEMVRRPEDADFIQLTGGADIHPSRYGQPVHPSSYPHEARDAIEFGLVEKFYGKFFLGVCRGAQLLNVFAGGSMWQDVDNHHGSHPVFDLVDGDWTKTNSIHHQMMIPTDDAVLLATAPHSTRRANGLGVVDTGRHDDPEVLFYPKQNFFCFQAHPEFDSNNGPTRALYLKMIDHCFG